MRKDRKNNPTLTLLVCILLGVVDTKPSGKGEIGVRPYPVRPIEVPVLAYLVLHKVMYGIDKEYDRAKEVLYEEHLLPMPY